MTDDTGTAGDGSIIVGLEDDLLVSDRGFDVLSGNDGAGTDQITQFKNTSRRVIDEHGGGGPVDRSGNNSISCGRRAACTLRTLPARWIG